MPPTDTQLKNRKLTAQGLPVIDIETLTNNQDILGVKDVSTPTVPIIPKIEITEPEQKISSAQKEIMRLRGETVGESERISTLEKERGIPGLTQTISDLKSRLGNLTSEAQAIPLQLQQEIEGRGVTTAGLKPLQTARLRENAIQTLTTQAQLEGARGNLTTALDLIDRAVKAEFDPIREELLVKEANLKTLLESPELSIADKNRANQLLIQNEDRKRAIEQEQKDKEYINNIMVQASKYGATPDILKKMSQSTPDEAVTIASGVLGESFKREAEQLAFDNKIKLREISLKEQENKLSYRKNLIESAKLGDKLAIKELGYDPNNLPLTTKELKQFEDQKLSFQRDVDIIDRALTNDTGLQESSGVARGGIASRLLTGGAIITPYLTSKKNDFIKDAKYVMNNLTFDKVEELSNRGIKLNPISEAEIKMMGEASNVLVSAAEYDDKGNLKGFKMNEDAVREELGKIKDHYNKAINSINSDIYISDDDKKEIIGL